MAGVAAAEEGTEGTVETEERDTAGAGESEEVEGSMADLRKKCVILVGGSKKDAKAAVKNRHEKNLPQARTQPRYHMTRHHGEAGFFHVPNAHVGMGCGQGKASQLTRRSLA